MSTHTPGPWNLVSQRANAASGSPVLSEIWSGNYVVARLGALHTERSITDARLIAAAELAGPAKISRPRLPLFGPR